MRASCGRGGVVFKKPRMRGVTMAMFMDGTSTKDMRQDYVYRHSNSLPLAYSGEGVVWICVH